MSCSYRLALASSFVLMLGCFLLVFRWGKSLSAKSLGNPNGEAHSPVTGSDPAAVLLGRKPEDVVDAPGEDSASQVGPAAEPGVGVLRREFGLSQREAEVILLIAQGNTRKAIAKRLLLGENSVATYSKSAYAKMGVHSRQEVIDIVAMLH